MVLGLRRPLMGISAFAVMLVGCKGDDGPTGPEGIWDFELFLEAIDVVADCEGPAEDSPGEWAWRITLEVAGQPAAVFGTPSYPDFSGSVEWSDGETHVLGESATVENTPGSQVPSFALTLEATEWDVGSVPPSPDGLMNGRINRELIPFAVGTVEGSLALADESGKCSILLSYSVVWERV